MNLVFNQQKRQRNISINSIFLMVKNKLKEGDELEVQEKEKLRNNYQGTTDNCKYLKEIP